MTGISLTDWLNAPGRFEIKNPKPKRGKPVFKLKIGFDGLGLKQLKHDGQANFELRSCNCQDAVYGKHLEGGEYYLIGNYATIPEGPAVLLYILQFWKDWQHYFNSALRIETEPQNIELKN